MKISFSTIFLFFILIQVVGGQNLDKETIDKKLGLTDQENVVYVVNGIPYQQHVIDSILNSFPNEHLLELTTFNNEDGKLITCTAQKFVLIVFAYQQPKKEIRNKLRDLKRIFTDNYNGDFENIHNESKKPALYINNKLIHNKEAKNKIENLKVNDIYFVNYKNEPQKTDIYGQNAENGLIRIWTNSNSK